MQVSQTEAKFLTHVISMWADSIPTEAGVPLMFTDRTGTKVLLTSDEIYSLYDKIRAIR